MDWITIVTSAVTALIVGFFGFVFYVWRTKIALQDEYERRFNNKKWEEYTKFAYIIPKMMKTLGDTTLAAGEKIRRMTVHLSELAAFSTSFWLVASDGVVRKYLAWQATTRYSEAYFLSLGNIVIEMRKDLGYESTQVGSAELIVMPMNAAVELQQYSAAGKQAEESKASPAQQ